MQQTEIRTSLLPAQYRFVFSENENPAIVAGLGAGKTTAGTHRLLKLMIDDPGISVLFGMPTYDLLNLRAIPGFQDALNQIGLAHKTNKSEYSVEVLGLGKIYFRSYNNPERFIAFSCAHSLLDEIDTLPIRKAAEVWRKVTERTRQKTANGINTIAAVTTPDHGMQGFVYDRWVRKGLGELIKAKTTDNPFLPAGYVEQIRANYDASLAELYINGEFVNLTSQKVYHFFSRERHHKAAPSLANINAVHIGLDFNVGGCCANTWILDGDRAQAIDEFISRDSYDFINNLSRYKGKQITVYPDASGGSRATNATQTDIQLIESAGYRVDAPKGNPAVRDRINAVNKMLSSDRLTIDVNKCPLLAEAFEHQGYTDKGEPEKYDTHPAIDDHVDAAGYFLSRKFPLVRPMFGLTGLEYAH